MIDLKLVQKQPEVLAKEKVPFFAGMKEPPPARWPRSSVKAGMPPT